eukprot:gnl/MRDRNA2_/MRDRNA2_84215_c0_seq2.p2 gnl/MRDRNA2_/MRDRNA2_84215_c0~~gnl/MRDRNA2_/MRDRNA2_84215_c0_seq2.p2  ORF type:complete len:155 (+),score=50.15 gnl/MRDRNA2_/MRDRNA2_84215_c0_seq2:78-542(+)
MAPKAKAMKRKIAALADAAPAPEEKKPRGKAAASEPSPEEGAAPRDSELAVIDNSTKKDGKGGAIVPVGGSKKHVPEGCKIVEKGKKEKKILTKADGSKTTVKQKVKEQRTTNRKTGTHIETKNCTQEKRKAVKKDGSTTLSRTTTVTRISYTD